jgi:hypothetical protein
VSAIGRSGRLGHYAIVSPPRHAGRPKGMPPVELDEAEFRRRFLAQFPTPAFDRSPRARPRRRRGGVGRLHPFAQVAGHRKAGPGYADPDYDMAVDWRAAKAAIDRAQANMRTPQPPCILIVNGSSRSEHTCPGEMSKSWRLLEIAARFAASTGSRSRCSTCRGWPPNTAPHPPLQGLLLDRGGALPLALLLLSELRARPDQD